LALLGLNCQAANRPLIPYDQPMVLRGNIGIERYWFGVNFAFLIRQAVNFEIKRLKNYNLKWREYFFTNAPRHIFIKMMKMSNYLSNVASTHAFDGKILDETLKII
jgi:hypothetical protein